LGLRNPTAAAWLTTNQHSAPTVDRPKRVKQ